MRRLPALPLKSVLLNTSRIELWPADLLRARSNADARVLPGAYAVLRRKQDGGYLAGVAARGVHPLATGLPRQPGLDEAWDALDRFESATRGFDADAQGALPLHALQERLHALGLDDAAYAERTGLDLTSLDESRRNPGQKEHPTPDCVALHPGDELLQTQLRRTTSQKNL